MKSYSRKHLSHAALRQTIVDRVLSQCEQTADLLADIAEFDERQLYREEGYHSLSAWCVGVLHMSFDEALKRIHAARAARRHPIIFDLVAAGRLHLTAVVMLAARLKVLDDDAAGQILTAAIHKTAEQIAQLLAERFPKSTPATSIEVLATPATPEALPLQQGVRPTSPAVRQVPDERTKVAPLAPEVYLLKGAMSGEMRELLRHLQSLLGHKGRDEMHVLFLGLQALKPLLEKRKFCATDRPSRNGHRPSRDPRHVPAQVKRAVWERDGGRCAYVSPNGHRCECRSNLQWDHIVPVKAGGDATVGNVRLLCHAHNQLMAEQVLGTGFMRGRRELERERREAARLSRQARADAEREQRREERQHDRLARRERRARLEAERDARRAQADKEREARRARREQAELERERDRERARLEQNPDCSIVPWLRKLGFTLIEARRAEMLTDDLSDAPLPVRVKAACRALAAPLIQPTRAPIPVR